MRASPAEQARALRRLHRAGSPLVLPNVWDAWSARAVAAAGLPAIATTSAAVAWSLGQEDGEAMPADVAFAALQRIAAAVEVPVTADIEAGYGLAPDRLVDALLDAGAVGCNLEDTDHAGAGLVPAEQQAERIARVREAAAARNVELVVNARVDCFLGGERSPELLEEALRRGRLYREAGADCVYPIAAADEGDLERMVGELGTINALLFAAGPPLRRLRELGVARISLGPNLAREAAGRLTERAAELQQEA
ncbi:MAG: isocitrate lyase/PEP mutase family protein [Candidatus Dormibacteraceae bacterium]